MTMHDANGGDRPRYPDVGGPLMWPLPADAGAHYEEAMAALGAAEELEREVGRDDPAVRLQVALVTAQVHAQLAGGAVQMQAAAMVTDALTEEEGDEAEHRSICPDCQDKVIDAVRQEVGTYLVNADGAGMTADAVDIAGVVRRVLFGPAAMFPPQSYRDQEG